jgi:hypothetical protein
MQVATSGFLVRFPNFIISSMNSSCYFSTNASTLNRDHKTGNLIWQPGFYRKMLKISVQSFDRQMKENLHLKNMLLFPLLLFSSCRCKKSIIQPFFVPLKKLSFSKRTISSGRYLLHNNNLVCSDVKRS